jgi:transcriptional regulator with XRE-family HTH domain
MGDGDEIFSTRIRRARELARENGLTQEVLAERVRAYHAIGSQHLREVLKGKRRPRGWHQLLRAVSLVLAEEDCRPISLAEKQRRYLDAIIGTNGVPPAYRRKRRPRPIGAAALKVRPAS